MARSLSQLKYFRPPLSTHGSKYRLSQEIINILWKDSYTQYYDMCCGGGAITIELIKKGLNPSKITMIDIGLWGLFWSYISSGGFSIDVYDKYISELPSNPENVKEGIEYLLDTDPTVDTVYKFIIIQACNFGGKMIRLEDNTWKNISIKPYWKPKPTSVRQTPSSSFTISPQNLRKRLVSAIHYCRGVQAYQKDVFAIDIPKDAITYIDPNYKNTYGYKYSVDIDRFIDNTPGHLYISETYPINHPRQNNAIQLSPQPKNSILNAYRKGQQHSEWLTHIYP